jgi:opacity protein-like surface antigen
MRRVLPAFLLLLSLPLRARAAAPKDEDESEEGPLTVGFKVDAGREDSARYSELGPTLDLTLTTSRKDAANRFKYELELGYDDYWTKLYGGPEDESSRVRTVELKYAKLSLLQIAGWDFHKNLGLVPFVTGGVQYVDSRADEGGTRVNRFYWAPTFGGGFDVALKKKLTLGLEYEQNTEGGARQVTRFSLELKYDVFGRAAD